MNTSGVPKWVWVALGVAASGAALVAIFSDLWPLTARCTLSACEEGREWLKAIVTGAVFLAGLLQYRRSQKWERAKFLANEMKAFVDNFRVQHALTMVDWAGRNINLYGSPDPNPKTWPLITRQIQTFALLPHRVVAPNGGEEAQRAREAGGARDSELASFSTDQATIRDCYDALLDGLEQFAGYVDSGLVSAKDLAPYIDYWINDIAEVTGNKEDDEWTCALFSYIDFYSYRGVQSLFRSFGYDIAAGSALYDRFLEKMTMVDGVTLKRVVLAERGGGVAR